jgi:hypothetical protein
MTKEIEGKAAGSTCPQSKWSSVTTPLRIETARCFIFFMNPSNTHVRLRFSDTLIASTRSVLRGSTIQISPGLLLPCSPVWADAHFTITFLVKLGLSEKMRHSSWFPSEPLSQTHPFADTFWHYSSLQQTIDKHTQYTSVPNSTTRCATVVPQARVPSLLRSIRIRAPD